MKNKIKLIEKNGEFETFYKMNCNNEWETPKVETFFGRTQLTNELCLNYKESPIIVEIYKGGATSSIYVVGFSSNILKKFILEYYQNFYNNDEIKLNWSKIHIIKNETTQTIKVDNDNFKTIEKLCQKYKLDESEKLFFMLND